LHPESAKCKIIKIHYIGWSHLYDEFIPSNSSRLAEIGRYTEDDSVAKYQVYVGELDGTNHFFYLPPETQFA
jgi:hypothetical protein